MKLVFLVLFCLEVISLKAQKLDSLMQGDTLTLYAFVLNGSCEDIGELFIVKEKNTFMGFYNKVQHCDPNPDVRPERTIKKSKILNVADSSNIVKYIDDFKVAFNSGKFCKPPASGNLYIIKIKAVRFGGYDCTKNKDWKEFEPMINNIFGL
jgi:hypothetical protein